MTKRSRYLMTAAVAFSSLMSASLAEPAAAEPPVSISSYTLIDSSVADGIDTRTYGLEGRNAGAEALFSVRAILRKASPYIAVLDAEVEFGPVAAGETVMGSDAFTIAVDSARLGPSTAAVGFVWEIVIEDASGWNEFLLSARLGVLEGY